MKENSKLKNDQKAQLLQWLSEFESLGSCQVKLMNEFGVNVSTQNISNYKSRYAKEIQKLRDEYLKNLAGVSISHVKVRLTLRQQMIHRLLASNNPGNFAIASRLLDGTAADLEKYYDRKFGKPRQQIEITKKEMDQLLLENEDGDLIDKDGNVIDDDGSIITIE